MYHFTGRTPVEVLLKHVRQQAPSARSLDPNISDAVDGVLNMALQKHSDDRFTSAEEFSHALVHGNIQPSSILIQRNAAVLTIYHRGRLT